MARKRWESLRNEVSTLYPKPRRVLEPFPAVLSGPPEESLNLKFEWEKKWHPALAEPEITIPHFAQWFRQNS
jgi:hypothetical protein